MEKLSLYIDVDGTGRLYDSLLARAREIGVQDTGDLAIATKNNGDGKGGAPLAMLTFTAVIKGSPVTVQTVTTVKLLKSTLRLLDQHYPDAPGA